MTQSTVPAYRTGRLSTQHFYEEQAMASALVSFTHHRLSYAAVGIGALLAAAAVTQGFTGNLHSDLGLTHNHLLAALVGPKVVAPSDWTGFIILVLAASATLGNAVSIFLKIVRSEHSYSDLRSRMLELRPLEIENRPFIVAARAAWAKGEISDETEDRVLSTFVWPHRQAYKAFHERKVERTWLTVLLLVTTLLSIVIIESGTLLGYSPFYAGVKAGLAAVGLIMSGFLIWKPPQRWVNHPLRRWMVALAIAGGALLVLSRYFDFTLSNLWHSIQNMPAIAALTGRGIMGFELMGSLFLLAGAIIGAAGGNFQTSARPFGDRVDYTLRGSLGYRASGRDIWSALELASWFSHVDRIELIDINYPNPPADSGFGQLNLIAGILRWIRRNRATPLQRAEGFKKLLGSMNEEAKLFGWMPAAAEANENRALATFSSPGRRLEIELLAHDARKYMPSSRHALSLVRKPGFGASLSLTRPYWERVVDSTEQSGYVIVERADVPNFILGHLDEWGLQLVYEREGRYQAWPWFLLYLDPFWEPGPIVFQKVRERTPIPTPRQLSIPDRIDSILEKINARILFRASPRRLLHALRQAA